MERVGQVLAELPAAVLVDDRHLVVAEAVDVILPGEERGVVDEELPDVLVPVGEDQAPDPSGWSVKYRLLLLLPFRWRSQK